MKNKNYQLWLNQYEAIRRSGLSIRSWANQNNLSAACIAKRITRLRQIGLIPEGKAQTSQKAKSSSHSFVEITAPSSITACTSTVKSVQINSADVAYRIELANGKAIIITNSISPELFQKFLETVIC